MLETRAIVVQTDNELTLVQASVGNGCAACEGKGCGSGKLTQLFCSKPRQFKVDNRINAGVGDEVIVAAPDGAVLRGISLVYLLPLVLLFAGATLAGSWAVQDAQRDGYAAAGALSGLVVGFVIAKWLLMREARQQPYIARLFRE
ncbi:MAG TPA: SoxR reducing system RseC family protein [Gallionella sp.]|jgi:sigma-E factor negative regulatory protein RseC